MKFIGSPFGAGCDRFPLTGIGDPILISYKMVLPLLDKDGFKVLKLPKIYTIARPENTASLRVIQRLGMISLGRTTRYYKIELEMFKLEANFARNC